MINWENIFGIQEIATATGLKEQTVRQYRSDGKLPKEDAVVSGNPLWARNTIAEWLNERENNE
jgi:predicted DNA-binding transcriptional regulator AlpA